MERFLTLEGLGKALTEEELEWFLTSKVLERFFNMEEQSKRFLSLKGPVKVLDLGKFVTLKG